jgi:AcrR family transcriptional regulator
MKRNPQTRERLLDAAEQLFLEKGFQGTSTRDITEAAGANLAAVNYHFRSKQDLMVAVAERVVAPILRDQVSRLDELQARAAPPTVAELVSAYVTPMVEQRERRGGEQIARFIGQSMYEDFESVRKVVGPVERRYQDAIARALPDLLADELELRFRAMIGIFIMYGLGVLTDGQPASAPERLAARITAVCAAALTAQ